MNSGTSASQKPLYSMAFFDVQNLFRHAMEAFQTSPEENYHHPCFDPLKLHQKVAEQLGYKTNLTRFYTGVPDKADNEMWAGYWAARFLALKRANVQVTSRRLRYHTREVEGELIRVPQEKGIDIRIALDLVSCARRREYDVAIIFSQDQDLGEVVSELHDIAKAQDREVKIVSAFPVSERASSARGIDRTDWFRIDKDFYDACIDPRDYRPAKFRPMKP